MRPREPVVELDERARGADIDEAHGEIAEPAVEGLDESKTLELPSLVAHGIFFTSVIQYPVPVT